MYPGVAGSYHDNGGMGYWVSGIVKVASEELRVANLFTPNLMTINIDIHFTFYSLLITHYSLLITRYSLLITHYSLLTSSSDFFDRSVDVGCIFWKFYTEDTGEGFFYFVAGIYRF